jgi:hypothetical protein
MPKGKQIIPQEAGGISRDGFIAFCLKLKIPAKEKGITRLELFRTQLYLLDQILLGLADGIHFFVVLKCRQSGITTQSLAFVLYWLFRHDGVIGHFIADNAGRKAFNRELLEMFLDSLKDAPAEWRQPVRKLNDELCRFGNDSMLNFGHANARSKGGLGRGTGVSLVHGTEVGLWNDPEGLKSLLSSLAESNPSRFYIFEGTANGPNLFEEMWDEASRPANVSQKAIFIGWWLSDDYQVPDGDVRFKTYWGSKPKLSRDESKWSHSVKERYGWEMTAEQLAWWRWHLAEMKQGDLQLMLQEYPWLPELAFQFGGNTFIDPTVLMEVRNKTRGLQAAAHYYRFNFGRDFDSTEIEEVDPVKAGWWDLVCWDIPEDGPVNYCFGIDPAHGASEDSANAVIQVLRCYSDQAVQVAEFAMRELPTYRLAWALLYVMGAYCGADPLYNVELAGGGHAVMQEIERLQDGQAFGYSNKLAKIFSAFRPFLYSRVDAVRPAMNSYHSRTTAATRHEMLVNYKNMVERGTLEVRSSSLIDETSHLERQPDGEIRLKHARDPDDRVMAMGLAVQAYNYVLKTDIGGSPKHTREACSARTAASNGQATPDDLLRHTLLDWRDRVILAQREERS